MRAHCCASCCRFHKERPGARLPPILAVVISHVRGGWTAARSFDDLLEPSIRSIPGLLALVPRFSLIIADLSRMSDEDLKARSLAAFQKLALWLLRDARDPVHLLQSFGTWMSALVEVRRAPVGIDAFAILLRYMFRVVGPKHHSNLQARIRQMSQYAAEAEDAEDPEEAKEIDRIVADIIHRYTIVVVEGEICALRRQLLFKFQLQQLDEHYEARLQAASRDEIGRYLERVLVAESLAAVFES